jgi:hypothetical protein
MKTARSMYVVAALAALSSFGVLAQAATSPSRADVRKEAVEAGKSGQIVSGECSPDQKADAGACAKKPVTSTKSRDEVKQDAVSAGKKGEIVKGDAQPAVPKK